MRRPIYSVICRAALVSAALVLGSQALAQSKPSAPSNLCISDSTGPSSCTNLSGAIKWHPGHYVRANAVGTAAQEGARRDAYDRIRNEPLFKGAVVAVTWGALEPQKDRYDFSVIDRDLAYLKSMGKRLIIEVWTTKYGGSASTDYFPQWIIDDGGVVNVANSGCCTVNLGDRYWMDRYIKLIQKLGERYNSDPYVEQLQTNETSTTVAREYKRLIAPAAAAWPNTPVVLYMNWVIEGPEFARELVETAALYGVGVGGPDILPPRPISSYGEDHGTHVLRGAGVVRDGDWVGDFGTTDYRGKIPVSYQYQGLYSMPPSSLTAYVDTMRMTHVAWSVFDSHWEGGNEMLWYTGVLPTVKGINGRINTACPTVYKGRCSSQ